MKYIVATGGYLLTLLLLVIFYLQTPRIDTENIGKTVEDAVIAPSDYQNSATEELQKIIIAKRESLAGIQMELSSLQNAINQSSIEEHPSYAELHTRAEQEVAREMAQRPTSQLTKTFSQFANRNNIRLRIESEIGVFLRKLELKQDRYETIIDQLTEIGFHNNQLLVKQLTGELTREEAAAQKSHKKERDILALHLNSDHLKQYDEFSGNNQQKNLEALAKNQIRRYGITVSDQNYDFVVDELAAHLGRSTQPGLSEEQREQEKRDALVQLESRLAARLTPQELQDIKPVFNDLF